MPTAGGVVWFKASAEEVTHEGPLAELLSARRPDVVPQPIAVDRARGWMLARRRPAATRPGRGRARPLGLARRATRYAELQRDTAGEVERMLALGELAAFGVPDTFA